MVMRPKEPCRQPGCAALIPPGTRYCAKHRENVYAIYKRDPFYESKEWRRVRARVRQEEPICRYCQRPAECVDHIIPRKQGGAPFDRSNLQSLCKPCHDVKRRQEGNRVPIPRSPFDNQTTRR